MNNLDPSPLRILLVEDTEHDRMLFERAFRQSDIAHTITAFTRAEDALSALQADVEAFDLVVTDHKLPGMTGIQLCAAILDAQMPIPLVMLTGTGSEHLAVDALKAGVDDYLIKDIGRVYTELLSIVLPRVVQKFRDQQAIHSAQAEREKLIGQLEALNEATRRITRELALESVLQNIANEARILINVKYAALGVHDGHGRISHFLTAGISEEVRAKIGPPPTGRGLLGHLLHQGQSIIVDDMGSHAESVGFPEHHPPMQQLLGIPIYAKETLIGALYLTDRVDGTPFTATDQYLIEMLARHAANAIENAQLYEQSQRVAVLEERDRFAQDLHDGIIQSIYGVGLALDQVKADIPASNETAIQHMDLSLKSLASVIQELRSYIFDLRPQAMEHHKLKTRLEALFQELETNLRLSVQANISPDLDTFISEQQARHIFHICHEALSNAARHAKASQLFVSLTQEDNLVTLRIEDDGIGFERPPRINPGHRGLANIQARATRLGAILNIDSLPQQGTRIILTFRSTASAE